jgi:hypothetical protein
MAASTNILQRRWYDQERPLQQTVRTILSFPDGLQNHIGSGLMLVVGERFKVQANDTKSLRSISEDAGLEAVQALYKASQRLRAWDKHPSLHRAMTVWRLLPKAQQQTLVVDALNLCKCMASYVAHCERQRRLHHDDELAAILKTFIEEGPERVLSGLQAASNASASRQQAANPPSAPPLVMQPGDGMGKNVLPAGPVIIEEDGDFKIRLH